MTRSKKPRDLNEGLYATGSYILKHDSKLYAYVSIKTSKVMTVLSDGPKMAEVKLRGFLRYEPQQDGGFKHRTSEEIDALMPRFELHTFGIRDDGRTPD